MKTKILSILIGIGALACGDLFAQRMPQDSWYLFKEFRGANNGGKFYHPHDAALGPDGNLYVADRYNYQVQVFDQSGNFLRKWGSYGSKPGEFTELTGIHVDPEGKVYVCEWQNGRVQVFTSQGGFIRVIGRAGNGDGQLNGPHGVTVDNEGNVYVGEHNTARVSVFRPDGSYLRQWGSSGPADGQFQGVIAVCRTTDNKIAVLERDGARRIQVFEPSGTLIRKFTTEWSPHGIETDAAGNFYVTARDWAGFSVFNSSGTRTAVRGQNGGGSGNGQFNPMGLAVGNGKVFACDYDNHRIAVFNTAGTWSLNFGTHGRNDFQDTHGIAVDSSGNIYISSHQDQEIAKFNKDYQFLRRFGSSGSGDGQFNGVLEMAVGPNNRLYVVDHSGHRVQIFDLEGNFVGKFGVNGSGDGQFNYPWGIAVSTNRVYVVDRNNNRFQIFDLNGNFIKKVGTLGSFGGQFNDPYAVSVCPDGSIVIGDRGNRRVQKFDSEGNFLKILATGWEYLRLKALSDGVMVGVYNWDGSFRVLDSDGNFLKEFYSSGGYGGALAEAKNGDLVIPHGDRVVRVWRRTFRTETPTTNNAIPLPVVLASSQRSGQKLLDLDYRVKDDDNGTVTVEAVAFNAGQNSLDDLILVKNFAEGTGANVGTNIPTGVTRRLTWDIAKDWGSDFGQLQMEVLAKDNRDLLNLDFIQMPAVGGDPLLKISRTPLNDSDFLSVWYWLLATEDPGIKLTYGKVFPTNAETTFTFSGTNGRPGLVGSYYPYTNFTGTPTVVTNEYINIRSWASASSPDTPIRWDKISARWTGRLVAETNGNHTIFFAVDDTGKIFMNNSTNASLNRTSGGESSFVTNLTAGTAVPITIEYTDTGGTRRAQLYWTPPGGTKQLIPPKNLFTGVATSGGSYSYYNPDGTNHFASGTTTTAAGRTYILDKMNYREATTNEVLRAKYAGTPGTINQWDPKLRVGPAERPTKVNAYNFETSADGTWVVPK